MKLKWKRLWIKALRSGKYKQGQHQLRQGDEFCCLGVLCKVVKPRVRWDAYNEKFQGESLMPPTQLLKEIGLPLRSAKSLAKMNDDGKTFEQIAKRIQAKY